MRESVIVRKTAETDIKLELNVDGSGNSKIDSGCGFLNHMLTLFSRHGRFDLNLSCKGDTNVDYHHTAEDIGICLGKAFTEALGDLRGITRYGSMILPMDETLMLSAIDISGRGFLSFDCIFPTEKIGDFDSELVKEFWLAFVRSFNVTLHIKMISGENSHHIAEAIFKSVARAISSATLKDARFPNEIPSTKGVL
ncbi:MAG: imidazoleglycerol-phosphate dehydratase HisB [Clostridia bacterium]|nr:imidazoleglycerol-phosphate dehydratase HisB [Clostridia bacterium]